MKTKKILSFFFSNLFLFTVYGQDAGDRTNDSLPGTKLPAEEIYTTVDVIPSYPGGMRKLYKYLSGNLEYPARARNNKIEGRVIVQFVVARDGSINNITIIEGVEETLDAEAVRVIREMPDWIPGMKDGEKVNVYIILPISFSLLR